MKTPTLLGGLALMAVLAAPVPARADDHHFRDDRRGHGHAYRYEGPRQYYRAYPPRHRGYNYDRYVYRPYGGVYYYDPYYYDDPYYDHGPYYYAPPPPGAYFNYYRGPRRLRPHVSLFFRW
jgi:hypothetical protein